jgi:hypothetical protein
MSEFINRTITMQQRLPLLMAGVLAALFLLKSHSKQSESHVARRVPGSSNDFCETAEPIAVGANVFLNTSFATPDSVVSNCIFNDTSYVNSPGLWYTLLGTGERLYVRSCVHSYDASTISVFTGNCSNLQCVAGKNGLCRGERAVFDTIAGTTYLVLIRSGINDFNVTLNVAPPPVVNDLCENAEPIAIDSKVSANLTFATSDVINDDCFNDGLFTDFPGVWYSLVGTGERVVALFCNNTYPTTSITVLEGSCGTTSLKCVAATREPCSLERFVFDTIQGTTYYILLRSDRSSTDDASVVELSISKGAPVPNDLCANAQPMSIGSTVRGDLSFATAEKGFEYSFCFDLGSTYSYPDVWYTFVGNGKQLSARLGPLCALSDETSILILTGGCNVTNLRCVAGTDFLCRRRRLLFNTVKGTRYHVIVKSKNIDRIVRLTIATCGFFRLGFLCPPTLQEILSQLSMSIRQLLSNI